MQTNTAHPKKKLFLTISFYFLGSEHIDQGRGSSTTTPGRSRLRREEAAGEKRRKRGKRAGREGGEGGTRERRR